MHCATPQRNACSIHDAHMRSAQPSGCDVEIDKATLHQVEHCSLACTHLEACSAAPALATTRTGLMQVEPIGQSPPAPDASLSDVLGLASLPLPDVLLLDPYRSDVSRTVNVSEHALPCIEALSVTRPPRGQPRAVRQRIEVIRHCDQCTLPAWVDPEIPPHA
jgi:hypothetical protein